MGLNKRLIDQAGGAAASSPFNVVTYTGNGGSTQSINTVGFQPDLVWIKARGLAQSANIFDSIRGGELLRSTSTAASGGDYIGYINDGFQFKITDPGWNQNGQNYVAWNWEAGGAAVSNTDGSITSSVSAHSSGSFSVVKYTGNDLAGGSVGHGLGVTPEMIIIKNLNDSSEWVVYHKNFTTVDSAFLQLNSTANVSFKGSGFHPWDVSAFSSTTFSLGSNWNSVNSSDNYVAYCFASIDGISKVGTYSGNGSSQTISGLGFQPRFLLIKGRSWSGNWVIFDGALVTSGNDNWLYANLANSQSSGNPIDFTSDGFTLNDAGADYNAGIAYLYLAFA
jgi:hypothetical protein